MEGMVSQHEVQEIIHDLQVKDRMQFTQATLHTSSPALHQKSGQYADPSVNKAFLASF
jgi:hypothetical protein